MFKLRRTEKLQFSVIIVRLNGFECTQRPGKNHMAKEFGIFGI
jgi:hypothetical protein